MLHRSWVVVTALAGVCIVGLLIQSAYGANEIRYSYNGGGQQIWIPVAKFSARSANYGSGSPGYDFILDTLADTAPLSGSAYYFPLIAGDPGSSPGVYMDAWAEYQVLPSDLPIDFDLNGGTWYFSTRCQQLAESDSANYNKDADWLVVNGDPGDLSMSSPTDTDWFTAAQASIRATDRICNDVHAGGGERPSWAWIRTIDGALLPKVVTLVDGKFTFRIYEAEASPWNASIDVICWSTPSDYVPNDTDYLNALIPGECPTQHIVSGTSPASNTNDVNTTMTITGTDLDLVTEIRLVPSGGGADLVGTNLTVSPDKTALTAEFATTGAQWGTYSVLTVQPAPCSSKTQVDAFQLNCAAETVFAGIEPGTVSNPGNMELLRIKGANVTLLTSVQLVYANTDDPNNPVIPGSALTPDGDDLLATFDLSCGPTGGAPAGPYYLEGTRNPDGCSNPERLPNALWLVKPPTGSPCAWQPWASSWSNLNKGDDLDPPNLVYNPTNWDYSFGQDTVMSWPKDTPDGSPKAFHFFWDSQPPETESTKAGSGGIYQEISVTPGVPITYSYWWKGAATVTGYGDGSWFELLVMDGPFNLYYADGYQESKRAQNNPYMVRKTLIPNAGGSFPWTQITDQTPADPGTYGPRPQTITPVNNVVTVVFKCGRADGGGLEFFLDNAEVNQNGGPNLLTNGTFDSGSQVYACEHEWMYQDVCETNFWLRSSLTPVLCPDPFADSDSDGDVDQADFAQFQLCYTGSNRPLVDNACRCLDINNDNYIDQIDFFLFEQCASGPGVLADTGCDD